MIGKTPRAAWKWAIGVAALAFALSGGAAAAAEFTMKFGTATFNESQHQYIKFYKEALEKASGGASRSASIRGASSGPSRA